MVASDREPPVRQNYPTPKNPTSEMGIPWQSRANPDKLAVPAL